MKVSELAKDLDTTSDAVLKALRSLKLKAKDSDQVLSAAVVSVIKSELKPPKPKKTVARKPVKKEAASTKAKKKTVATTKEKVAKEMAATKKTAKTKVDSEPKVEKITATKKKVADDKVVKETPKTKKVVSRPVRVSEKGMTVKKKTVVKKAPAKDVSKSHPKISTAPVITLKPLARKRKKPSPTGKGDAPAAPVVAEKKDEIKIVSPFTGVQETVSQEAQPEAEPVIEIARDESLPDIEIQVPITVK
ncbi:MAG: hypothetical protein KAS92_04330, partial [Candidatus Omnitrophica bacterium]|nr:hypothetical protein [Candidatus Omnitrophota bacterium]